MSPAMGMHFSICIEMIYPDLPFSERIRNVAEAGFNHIEIWDWRNKPLDEVVGDCAELDASVTNMSGQRAGSLIDPGEFGQYKSEVAASVEAARTLASSNLMLLTNPLDSQGQVLRTYPEIPSEQKRENCLAALSDLTPIAADNNINLLLEPLNSVIDHPGYWLHNADLAFEIVRAVGHPGVRLLYDLYHMQAMGRNVTEDIGGNLDSIGYLHAADYPGRHEPGTGTMDYPEILKLLDSLGYEGMVGFEFSPATSSDHALATIFDLVEPFL